MIADSLFDGTGAVPRPQRRRLIGETWSLVAPCPPFPDPAGLPAGGGRTVLVVPPFLAGDLFTAPLRDFLGRCGFRALGWGLGTNWGPTPRLLAGLRQRLLAAPAPVAVVGISLGGALARDLAHDHPGRIAHVATLASPVRLPTASTIEPLVRLCARRYARDVDLVRLARPVAMPSTAIYTIDDGIVAWQSCIPEDAACHVVAVDGPHTTIARHPEAVRTLVRRLAA